MEKSYVTMERKMCPLCGKEFDTGNILMDQRLRNQFEQYTTTGYALCPADKKDGYIALIVVDSSKSRGSGNHMEMKDAYRTGEVCHVRTELVKRMFNNMGEHEFAFIDDKAFVQIKKMMEVKNEGRGSEQVESD